MCPEVKYGCQTPGWGEMSGMWRVWRKEAEDWGDSKDEVPKGGKAARGRKGGSRKLIFQAHHLSWLLRLSEGSGAWASLAPQWMQPLRTDCFCASKTTLDTHLYWELYLVFLFSVFVFGSQWLSQETSSPGTVLCGPSINLPFSSANFQIGHNGRWKINK